jgi:hypothetical protein
LGEWDGGEGDVAQTVSKCKKDKRKKKLHASVVIIIFIRLYNHHHSLIPEHSHHHRKEPKLDSSQNPTSSGTNLLFTSMEISDKSNHTKLPFHVFLLSLNLFSGFIYVVADLVTT